MLFESSEQEEWRRFCWRRLCVTFCCCCCCVHLPSSVGHEEDDSEWSTTEGVFVKDWETLFYDSSSPAQDNDANDDYLKKKCALRV